jgi:hypothetical protein
MKKTFLGFAFAALAMLATSCSSEIDAPTATDGDVTVSFTAQLPGQLASRSYSDGTTAKKLHYAVYAAGTNEVIFTSQGKDLDMTDKSATVSLNLVNGRSYDVVFWAYSTGGAYSYDDTEQKVYVDVSSINCNDENLDAFYAVKTFTVTGPITESIELTRPFAQINIGTNDIKEANNAKVTAKKTKVKVKGYTAFNVMDGSVKDETTLTFSMAPIPSSDNETFPYQDTTEGAKPYEYLAMVYVLVPAEKQTVDVKMTVDDATNFEKTYSNIPVQRNYRTNIYGSLFTSPINYNVVINPAYNESDYNVGITYVASAAELVNALKEDNPNLVLDNDFSLTSFGDVLTSEKAVDAIIDLNGHTLTLSNATTTVVPENKKLEFKNGTFTMPSYGTTLAVTKGGSVTFQDVKINAANSGYPLSCQGEGANLTIDGCQMKAKYFCISSNASQNGDTFVNGKDATIVLKNSTFESDETGFMNNVPANITMTNCKFYGNHQGALLRGGTYTIDGCTFVLNATLPDTDAECKNNGTWADGNRAAYAALVLGNRTTTSYQYPTTVKFVNNASTFETTGTYASSFDAVYAYANAGEGLGVYITNETSIDFSLSQYNLKASSNIWLNGTETAPATADE